MHQPLLDEIINRLHTIEQKLDDLKVKQFDVRVNGEGHSTISVTDTKPEIPEGFKCHDGSELVFPEGVLVDVIYDSKETSSGHASEYRWYWIKSDHDIIAYKVTQIGFRK